MRKIFEVILVIIFVTSTLGASTYAKPQTDTLKTKISLDTNSPLGISVLTQSSEKISLVFNKNSVIPLMGQEQKIVNIVPGDSNTTIAQNQAKEQERQRIAMASQVKSKPRISGVRFNGNFDELYKAAGGRFGVPWQILAAVHSVESGQSGDTTRSSYAGATGPMQFLPSTFRAYAVDGDGDGVANIHGVVDSVYTAARYISANMAKKGSIEGALWCYNHSGAYVQKVLAIARSFGL